VAPLRVFSLALAAFLFWSGSCIIAYAGENDVPPERFIAERIPSELLNGADAVIRHQSGTFIVKDARRAEYRQRTIVTVLNARATSFGEIYLPYDKFMSIEDIEGRILDARGKELRSLKGKEIADYPATSGYSLYDDNRVKSASLVHNEYPYTLDISYEYAYDGFINWPSWYPENSHAAVEYSRFQVEIPSSTKLRYWKSTLLEPMVSQSSNNTRYVWEARGLPPFEREPVGPVIEEQYQCVRIAPTQFELEGIPGDLSSWKSFGEWNQQLWSGRQVLPDMVRQQTLEITRGFADPKERIKALYQHLQKTTRYVSIQLGIGGWQPFDALYVRERGYGDCKALVNYMSSMLAAIGIESYPALIHNGPSRKSVTPNFSYHTFNHVILCVPLKSDTVWLECTSQTTPFGHIGQGNEDRYALMVTPKGSSLIRTPASTARDNRQERKAILRLTSLGTATAQIQISFTGNQQDYVRYGLHDATPREKEEWLKENLQIPVFTIKSADFFMVSNEQISARMMLQIGLPQFAVVAGNRLLFQPNLMERNTYVPPALTQRKHPVVHSYPYLDIDTITYHLPEGFVVEGLPKPAALKSGFAAYESNLTMRDAQTLLYTRRLEMNFEELPAGRYAEYRKFLLDVVQADKANAAIVRK
jgi:transglutaminase-like putative cysteine protease